MSPIPDFRLQTESNFDPIASTIKAYIRTFEVNDEGADGIEMITTRYGEGHVWGSTKMERRILKCMGPCDKFGHQEITFSKDMNDKP